MWSTPATNMDCPARRWRRALLLCASSTLLLECSKAFLPTQLRPHRLRMGALMQSQESYVEVDSSPAAVNTPEPFTDAVICGGGPAGLLSAIMLAQKFPDKKITVFDRLDEPLSPTDEAVWGDLARFYQVGLGGRGQTALSSLGLWDEVKSVCTSVVGRKDWAPGQEEGVERIFEGRKFTTEVLPRDKLVGVLYQHIQKYHADKVSFFYGYEVHPRQFAYTAEDRVTLEVERRKDIREQIEGEDTFKFTVTTDLLIAADGTVRTVANEMERLDADRRKDMNPISRLLRGRPFRVKRYDDDNQRIYKTIPINLPSDWRPDLNYSARSPGGRVNIDALPANRNGGYCAVLLLRKDDEMAQADVDPLRFREFLNEYLPQFSALIDDETLAVVAKKPPSFLPGFRCVGPRLNEGCRSVILGDCAHTVKPYFGLGANSALEDVTVLGKTIDDTESIPEAIAKFSKLRATEGKKLVKISRDLDRPGKLGTFTFLIPLILDSIFNKIAPSIFAPNIITMLQRHDMTFAAVSRRKALDRILQLATIGSICSGMTLLIRFGMIKLAQSLGRKTSTVTQGVLVFAAGAVLAKRMLPYLVPGMAPADVLAKSRSSIGSKDSFTDDSD